MAIESGGDDIASHLAHIQYVIDGHMDNAPDLTLWYYSEPGWQDDVVAGQMDVETLAAERMYRFSIVAWLGPNVFDEGPAAYSVRDMDGGPIIAWPNGARTAEELHYYDAQTHEPAETISPVEQLADVSHLLDHGEPVFDAFIQPEDSIHRRPSFAARLALATELLLSVETRPDDPSA